jgi:hypothetical protein
VTFSPLDDDLFQQIVSADELAPELRLLLEHPDLFILRYFSHRISKFEDFHLRLMDTAVANVRGLILYPAAHGKTTITSTLLPIWELCRDPNIRMAIIGKNDDEAEGIMRVILAELEDNDDLIRDFGPFKPDAGSNKPWGVSSGLMVAKRTRRAKEPTIAVFGSGARTVLGHRTDWTICDDVITEKNSATPEQRQKTRDWFNLSVETMCEHATSRLTVVGTRFDPADLYGDLLELIHPETGEPIYHVQHEDAIVDEDNKVPLWPAQWPWNRLMEQKAKMGTLDFNKRYRNIAVDKSRMVFREEYVKGGWLGKLQFPGCLDRTFTVGDFDESWPRYAGFDPAVGKGRSSKFCAHVVIGIGSCVRHERCIWVIDIERDQMASPRQRDLILEKHERYGLLLTMVEANSYQEALRELVIDKMNDQGNAFKIEPHYTNRTNKPDPEAGVQAMAPWFEQGKVHIPWAEASSQKRMRQFVDELIEYPGKTTDTVLAFWFAWRQAMQKSPQYQSFSRLSKHKFWRRQLGTRVIQNPAYYQGVAGGD